MESALVFGQVEERQFLHFSIDVIADALVPNGPVAASLGVGIVVATFHNFVASGLQVFLEFGSALFGENVVQSLADAVHLAFPDGVAVGVACLEVHV